MRTFPFASAIILVLTAWVSCKTVKDDFDTDPGHGYLALEMGKAIEYTVDSTIYDPTGDSAVFYTRSYLRDVIADTLRDNTGELLYLTERFFRKDSTAPWQIQKVYTQSISDNQGIVTKDNLRWIKLAFPIRQFNSWDALVHMDPDLQMIVAGETLQPFLQKGIWRARILSAGEPGHAGVFNFDKTLLVREVNTGGFEFDPVTNHIVPSDDENDPPPL
ncbi:MAG TPA: hypothetical protein ENJ20_05340, partial [Bacteroidetes bacterium]|nr:hypothetical protein [Bacteroidota bacterium]